MRTLLATAAILCCLAADVHAEIVLPPGCSGEEAERGILDIDRECASALAEKNLPLNLRVDALMYQGLWHHRARRNQEAVRNYEAGLEIDPDHAKLLQLRAMIYYWAGHYARAKEMFERSAAVDPTRSTTMDYLGRLAVMENDYAKGLGYYNSAIELRPANHEARYMRAGALYNLSRGLDALSDTQALISVEEKDLNAIGSVTVETGSAPLWLAASVLHGKVLGLLDRHADGETHFNALVASHPSALTYSERALFLLTRPIGLGKPSRANDAVASAERAVEAEPQSAYAHSVLATCLETVKDYNGALAANVRALENEDSTRRLVRLGWQHARILRMMGRQEEATPIAQAMLIEAFSSDPYFFGWLHRDLTKRGYWREPDNADQVAQVIHDAAAACMQDDNCGWN